MKLTIPQFKGKASPIWLIGFGVIALVIILLSAWLTRGGATIDSAIETYKSGDITHALELFARADSRHQLITAEGWNTYGNAYRDNKDLAKALEAYQKAIQLDSGYESAYRNLSYAAVDLSAEEKTNDRINQAIDLIEQGHQKHPKSVFLVEDLIMLYGEVGNTAKVNELKALREQLLK